MTKYLAILAAFISINCSAQDFTKLVIRIVQPFTPNQDRVAVGTAFPVVSPHGNVYTMTNAHICAHAKDGIMWLDHKKEGYEEVNVLIVNYVTDLCILESRLKEGIYMASSARVGEYIRHCGFAGGKSMSVHEGKLLTQELKCTLGNLKYYDFETNADVNPGASGSPVINRKGELVGVVHAKRIETTRGLIIPLEDVKKFLEAL